MHDETTVCTSTRNVSHSLSRPLLVDSPTLVVERAGSCPFLPSAFFTSSTFSHFHTIQHSPDVLTERDWKVENPAPAAVSSTRRPESRRVFGAACLTLRMGQGVQGTATTIKQLPPTTIEPQLTTHDFDPLRDHHPPRGPPDSSSCPVAFPNLPSPALLFLLGGYVLGSGGAPRPEADRTESAEIRRRRTSPDPPG